MSFVITKDCFPLADKCHNCLRKVSNHVKKKPIAVKDYKRCSGCHLFTYCDRDCQAEHWNKIHKSHCRFLSGKAQVNNSKHNPATCDRCIEERDSSLTQLRSGNSPKTSCNIEENAITMKKKLGRAFDFHMSDQVDSLQTIYGASNPWWKCLKFTIDFMEKTKWNLDSNFYDSNSLEDTRFENLKLLLGYRQSQLQNQAVMFQQQFWPMLWPRFVNGSLSVLLPRSTRCHSCFTELFGDVAVSSQEANWKYLPILFSNVGDNGALMACCATTQNPNCRNNCAFINVEFRMQSDEDQWKDTVEEFKMFTIESRDCGFCLKLSLSSHRCSACLTVQYCSTVCQKKDLEFHKSVCATWAKDKSRKIKGKDGQMDHWKSAYLNRQ